MAAVLSSRWGRETLSEMNCWLKLWIAGWAKALFLEPRVTGRDLRDARLVSEPVTSRDSVLEMGPSPTAWSVCFSGEDTVNDGYSVWKP